MAEARFKRVLLKLSGEALLGSREYGTDADRVEASVPASRVLAVPARSLTAVRRRSPCDNTANWCCWPLVAQS